MRSILVPLVVGLMSLTAVLPFSASGQQPAAAPPVAVGAGAPLPVPAGGATYYRPTTVYGAYSASGQTVINELSSQEQQLDQQSRDLARQISQTENRDEKSKLKEKLADVLRQQFEAQQKRRQVEIQAIEDRLKKLREMMSKRDDKKKEIIDRRLEQLIEEAEGLGWSTFGGQPGWAPANGRPGPVPVTAPPAMPARR